MQTYSTLALHGFRRSGENVYKPQCEQCSECIPIRVLVDAFQASRNQKRTWNKNADLQVRLLEPVYKEAHFTLFKRYIASRHSSGEMDYEDPAQYLSFLTSSWAQTVFIEFTLQQKVVAVAIADVLKTGLSAVYSFFDPGLSQRSLGVYAVLWEIEEARRRQLPWIFLGYWIKDCKKMNYKTQYQPAEGFRHAAWEVFDR